MQSEFDVRVWVADAARFQWAPRAFAAGAGEELRLTRAPGPTLVVEPGGDRLDVEALWEA